MATGKQLVWGETGLKLETGLKVQQAESATGYS